MKKTMKKLVALCLAMVMILAMGLTSFAAETADKSVTVRFAVASTPAGADTSNVPAKSVHAFTFSDTSDAFTAIKTAAETLKPGVAVVTGEDTSVTPTGKYFNSIFGLATVNNYADKNNDGEYDYWEGYSWNIQLVVKESETSTKTIDAPSYANLVNLGSVQTFTDYTGTELATGEVTQIIVTYKGDSMNW